MVQLENSEYIYLCECGKYRHYKEAVYCSECGRKIDKERKNALAERIEPLLEQWHKENK